jgi:hypothetical protein
MGANEDDCLPMVLSWEGAAEVQSGDILLVRIDDSQLALAHSLTNRTPRSDTDRLGTIFLVSVQFIYRKILSI